MQVFYRKGFKLLAGFLAEQKSEKQKQRGDTDARKQRQLRPRPARRKKLIINCSSLKRYGSSTAERGLRLLN
jgi:hypothetical protein